MENGCKPLSCGIRPRIQLRLKALNTNQVFVDGMDEITWFSEQPLSDRNAVLAYLNYRVPEIDPAGHLQPAGVRMIWCNHTELYRHLVFRLFCNRTLSLGIRPAGNNEKHLGVKNGDLYLKEHRFPITAKTASHKVNHLSRLQQHQCLRAVLRSCLMTAS